MENDPIDIITMLFPKSSKTKSVTIPMETAIMTSNISTIGDSIVGQISYVGARHTLNHLLQLMQGKEPPKWVSPLDFMWTILDCRVACVYAAIDADCTTMIDVMKDSFTLHDIYRLTKHACRKGFFGCLLKLIDGSRERGMWPTCNGHGEYQITLIDIAKWSATPIRNARGCRTSKNHDAFIVRVFGNAIECIGDYVDCMGSAPYLLKCAAMCNMTSALWICERRPDQVQQPDLVQKPAAAACRYHNSAFNYKQCDAPTLERLVCVLDLVDPSGHFRVDLLAEIIKTGSHDESAMVTNIHAFSYPLHLSAYATSRANDYSINY